MDDSPITVVCDGCRPASSLEAGYRERLQSRLDVHPCKFSKRGIVTDEIARNYEEFQRRLRREAAQAGYDNLSLLPMQEHAGFAMAVKAGLESAVEAGAQYALVVQHDRAFCRRVPKGDMDMLFDFFRSSSSCRYIGFPSGTSKLLAGKMSQVYKLHHLLNERSTSLRPTVALRPSIFWYDSNHLVDAKRALEIFEPYSHAPDSLRDRIGGVGINRFRLRRGDFIEERFGVEQRNLLASLRDEPAECLRLFDWFGTYMLEEVLPPERKAAPEEVSALPVFADQRGRVTYIDHVDARGALPPSERRAGAVRVLPKRHNVAGDHRAPTHE